MMKLKRSIRRSVTPDDILFVGSRLRASDLEEIEMMYGDVDPCDVLAASVAISDLCQCVEVRGEVVGMGGVTRGGHKYGVGWVLGTDLMSMSPTACHRWIPEILEDCLRLYPRLGNWVYEKNDLSLRWLTHMGFKETKREILGIHQVPFVWMEKKRGRKKCVQAEPASSGQSPGSQTP